MQDDYFKNHTSSTLNTLALPNYSFTENPDSYIKPKEINYRVELLFDVSVIGEGKNKRIYTRVSALFTSVKNEQEFFGVIGSVRKHPNDAIDCEVALLEVIKSVTQKLLKVYRKPVWVLYRQYKKSMLEKISRSTDSCTTEDLLLKRKKRKKRKAKAIK